MGLLPCPLPCQQNQETESLDNQSNPNKHLYSSDDSSSSSSSKSLSSISSQPSLPSVPSLTTSNSNSNHYYNYSPVIEQAPNDHGLIATLKGGGGYVFCLALAGKHLYGGSSDGGIFVSGRHPNDNSDCTLRLVAQSGSAVKSIVVLGDKLITAHQDHRIRVWKTEEELTRRRRRQHKYYKCIATLPTLNDRCMKLLSAKNYVEVRRHKKCTWVHHVDTVSALALSKDNSLLFSVSWDRTLKLWRTSDFKCLQSLSNAHDDAVNALTVSHDGAIFTGSADKKIKVWRRESNDDDERKSRYGLVTTLEKHKSTVNALALSTDGSVLYSGACDRSILVWEGNGGPTMEVVGALRGHTKSILALAVVAEVVVSGSADKTVRVWRRGIGKSYCCLAVLEGHSGPVKCLTAALDQNYNNDNEDERNKGSSYMVYSGGLDCDVKVWKIWVPNV